MNRLTGLVVSLSVLLTSCAAVISSSQFGVQDSGASSLIERINKLSTMRNAGQYQSLASQLEADAGDKRFDSYGPPRIYNELASIYSHQLLDIEKAIEIDLQLLGKRIPDVDPAFAFVPQHEVASQRIVADKAYLNEYIKKSAASIVEDANARLMQNRQLVAGVSARNANKYTRDFLVKHTSLVKNDLNGVPVNSSTYYSIVSRLIRAEYEMMLLGEAVETVSSQSVLNGSLKLDQIDLAEIDFLSLANYFTLMFKKTRDIRFAEFALETVYRPYQNLRDPNFRWKYNKLINDYITTLIEANFQAGRFDDMLYYASLNKSRMLLEERLTFSGTQGDNKKMSDFVINDGIPRSAGLPDKAWFKSKLASSPQFLDFYVGGTYVTEKLAAGTKASRAERSVMPLNSRNSSRVRTDEPADTFVDDALYLTQVNAGRVTAVKLSGSQLSELRREMERSYDAISNTKAVAASPAFQKLKTRLKLVGNLAVSPDKWVATHPLDFHLQSKVVRSVNFFTAGTSSKLDGIRVAGFFNPTLDLAGADGEADVIKALMPSAGIVRRESARKSALKEVAGANVIHLSMHGYFNAADPTLSKLLFAGSAVDDSSADPNALYATEMATEPALRNRDLVFAAACQTGLLAADRTNSSELTGILRPLTANRNKNIILSLWNVSDQATGEFVKAFYQKLAATQDVTLSFHHAQDQLRAKYPHPYYWAAFYLSQAS